MYQYDKIGKGVQTRYNEPMCLLNPIRTMVLFEVILLKKSFFHIEEFSNEILQLVIYFIYSCHSMSHIFWKSNLSRYNFFKCTDLTKFCVASWKMITISNDIITCWNVQVLFVCYKPQHFFKQYIHCITFTCCKGFMNFQQTLIFYKQKIEKNMKIWVLLICF
jgi:hypothetical protein